MADMNQEQQQQHATTTPPFCCCCCCCSNNTSMKRRSPPPSSATATEEDHIMIRACKKLHLREQQGTINIPFHSSPDQEEHANLVDDNEEGPLLTKEKEEQEPSNSMRLRRMKGCLRETRKCWEDVMGEEEEELQEDEPEGSAEGDKSKDECGGDDIAEEEAVRVEWADKCLSLRFKCPCTKGYQILLSGNNCYYKLL